MMRMLLILISIIASLALQAQDYQYYLQYAEEAKADDDPYGALAYYEKAFALDSSDQSLQFAYAEALEATHYYLAAERLYQKIYLKTRGRRFPQGPARIAQLKMYLGEYEGALKFWSRALRYAEGPADEARMQQRMRSCAYALSYPLEVDSIMAVNAGEEINSIESEYAADLFGEGVLLFSSLRGDYNKQLELKSPERYASRIYQSEKDDYGYSSARRFSMPSDSLAGHIGNPCPGPTGEYLYYTMLDSEGFRIIKRMNVFSTQPRAETLGKGINLPESNSSQPYVYLDADNVIRIIFSSDRPGGEGGYDLWTAKLSGTGDAELRNLGSKVNSPGNEVTPYYNSATNSLYFSSDWHAGFGGYDVFKCNWSGLNTAGRIDNLGLPINSSVNDLYFREREEMRLLTSNRTGSLTEQAPHCCNDIYFIEARPEEESISYESLPESIDGVDELRGLLPISLYFHNDRPDPGSGSNQTRVNYDKTATDYLAMETEYIQKYCNGLSGGAKDSAAMDMHLFFAEQVRAEFNELEGVSRLIFNELEKGKRIEIAIKGYASPLAKSDYNRKLTQRRIASVINYLRSLDDGVLKPYLRGEYPALSILPIPYGEEASETFVSDNAQDAQNSIYSIAAARERRVEILRIMEVD